MNYNYPWLNDEWDKLNQVQRTLANELHIIGRHEAFLSREDITIDFVFVRLMVEDDLRQRLEWVEKLAAALEKGATSLNDL